MAVYASPLAGVADKDIPRRLGARLGLARLHANPLADEDGISSLEAAPEKAGRGYIPYSNQRLLWHTDGYYNAPEQRIRAFILHCVRPAAAGGENRLLDPEIAYILLRDADPQYVKALSAPDAMTIPANAADGAELRPAQTGPVFSADAGALHMRYTARTRSIEWRPDDDDARRGAVSQPRSSTPIRLTCSRCGSPAARAWYATTCCTIAAPSLTTPRQARAGSSIAPDIPIASPGAPRADAFSFTKVGRHRMKYIPLKYIKEDPAVGNADSSEDAKESTGMLERLVAGPARAARRALAAAPRRCAAPTCCCSSAARWCGSRNGPRPGRRRARRSTSTWPSRPGKARRRPATSCSSPTSRSRSPRSARASGSR